MVVARTPRSAWIEAGLRALAGGGPDAVRIEALARELGVTKGGFYWHFENRQALLDDMLDEWERVSIDEVIEHIEDADDADDAGDAKSKLERLGAIALDTVLGVDPVEVDLAIRGWARHDEQVARRLRRLDNRRMDYMRVLFSTLCTDEAEIEDRCLLVSSLLIGSHFIATEHRGRSRAAVVERAFRRVLDA